MTTNLADLVAAVHARTTPAAGGHLIWNGSRAQDGGTPVFKSGNKSIAARRVMFQHVHGRAPQGTVRAACQQELCVAHVDDTAGRQRIHQQVRALNGLGPRPDTCTNGHNQATEGRIDGNGHAYCEACVRASRARRVARQRNAA
ncbi:hypothetical protein ACFYOY_13615 [Streptomyces sp. NPDC007875]|uniref:hypothetical protein n=1 Tax=Streptomyces sp. NPDC007875 TaxID=3364783 RepID=UPI0036B747F8